MRPCGPVPATPARSTPSAAAARVAMGVALASPAIAGAAPAPLGEGAAWLPLGAPFAEAPAGAPAPSCIRAMTCPTTTVAPSSASSSVIVPAAGAGSSMSTLSVEISTIVSPSSTTSPTLTAHSKMVPSVTDSPPAGVVMSTISPGRVGSVRVCHRRRRAVAIRRSTIAGAGRDLGEHGAHLHGVALGEVDRHDGSARGSGHLRVHLVGRDLDDDLVGLDGVTNLLVPLQDGAFRHRLAHGGQGDLNRCGFDGHVSFLDSSAVAC